MLERRGLLLGALPAACIGVLTDLSGPLRDTARPGSVVGATPAARTYGRVTVALTRALSTDDDCFGRGEIRADGRMIHPAYLFQVKTPSESRRWDDVLMLLATTPAAEAFEPMSATCPMARG